MKRKSILFLSIGIICLIFIGLCFFLFQQRPKKASVEANNKIIYHEQAKVYRNYATIPMFEVLEGYGVSIKWLNENDAIISYENINFTLSLNRMELIDERNGNNWFLQLPGSTYYYCEHIGSEIILDDNTMHNVLLQLGIETEIILDYRGEKIFIKPLVEK